jgi:hypothetical protein
MTPQAPHDKNAPGFFSSIPQATWVRVLIVLQLSLLAWEFYPDLSTNGDDARYYLLGQAMREGKGYRQIQLPNAPVETGYPIAFPLLLTIVSFVSSSIMVAKIFLALCGALTTLLCYFLFKNHLRRLLVPMLALWAVSSLMVEFSSSLMSEIPFLLFSILALVLYERSAADPKNAWLFWLTIAVSVVPMHCRSVGLAFSAAWILNTLVDKRYRFALAHVGMLAVTVVVFHVFTTWQNSYLLQLVQKNSYAPDLGYVTVADMLERIGQNIKAYGLSIVSQSLIPLPYAFPPFAKTIVSALCVALILTGWVRGFFGRMRFASLYVFLYFGILVMWQFQWSSERFVVGVLPFLYYFLLSGLDALMSLVVPAKDASLARKFTAGSEAPSRAGGIVVWAVVAIIGFFNVYNQPKDLHLKRYLGPDWRNFYSCADWVRINAPQDAVVMSRKPELFYVRAKRTGLVYPFTHNTQKIIDAIDSMRVSHVVLDNFAWTATSGEYLYPAIRSNPGRFKIAYALNNPPTVVYEVVKR